jgi:hypothetical protein
MKIYKCPLCKCEIEVLRDIIIVVCRNCHQEMIEVKVVDKSQESLK